MPSNGAAAAVSSSLKALRGRRLGDCWRLACDSGECWDISECCDTGNGDGDGEYGGVE